MSEFIELVHRHFDSLAHKHRLVCVVSAERIVRFENEKVFLQIHFDASRSYEVGVEIGRRVNTSNHPERPFNLAEILKLRASPESVYVERLQASQSAVLANAIERLSDLTRKYAARLLDGYQIDFAELSRFRKEECANYALATALKQARKQAENAWAQKDFATVVRLYKPLHANLTPAEKKRLAYAEKHI